jgi:hypothetical protein
MPRLIINVDMDTAPFRLPSIEAARILRELAQRIEVRGVDRAPFNLYDADGNKVGEARTVTAEG